MLEALGVGGIQNVHSGEVAIDSSDESWADIDGMHELFILIFGASVLAWRIQSIVFFSFSPTDSLYDQKALQ